MTYLDDRDIDPVIVFEKLDEVLVFGTEMNRRFLPPVLASTVENSLARLLDLGVHETTLLLQKHLPYLHERALGILGDAKEDIKRLTYLRTLLCTHTPWGQCHHTVCAILVLSNTWILAYVY